MELTTPTQHPAGIIVFGAIGLALLAFSMRSFFSPQRASFPADRPGRDLERLFSDIQRGLRGLPAMARAGIFFHQEKQEQIGRLLSQLQAELRQMEDSQRLRYESKAGRVLADAARAGITLPPPEMSMDSGRWRN